MEGQGLKKRESKGQVLRDLRRRCLHQRQWQSLKVSGKGVARFCTLERSLEQPRGCWGRRPAEESERTPAVAIQDEKR